MGEELLRVDHITTEFYGNGYPVRAVDNVSFMWTKERY